AREVVARGGVDDPPALVRDYAAALVERNPFEPDALVADRAQDEPAFDRLALPRVASADRSGIVPVELVARHDQPLDLAVPLDLDRRAQKTQRDPLPLA